jgi:hypothetical protein
MLNIHLDQRSVHSSDKSIEEASCCKADKYCDITFGPKISCIVVRCIIEEASCWQEDTLKCWISTLGPKISCIVVRCMWGGQLLARDIKMLNIHSWTRISLHSSEVHSRGGQLLARGHIKMLNIHFGPKDQLHSVRCIVRRPVVGKRAFKMLNIHSGPKIRLHSSEVHSGKASCWQEDTLKCWISTLGPKISCSGGA